MQLCCVKNVEIRHQYHFRNDNQQRNNRSAREKFTKTMFKVIEYLIDNTIDFYNTSNMEQEFFCII